MNLPAPDIQKIQRAIAVLFAKGQTVEFRALRGPGEPVLSGYYNDSKRLTEDIYGVSNDKEFQGCYWTLQTLGDHIKATNRYRDNCTHTTKDQDVSAYRWLYFDADPERAAGFTRWSATDAEKETAHREIGKLYIHLRDVYGYDSIIGDSGNGYHCLVRIDVPASDADLVRRVIASLASRFPMLDTKVYNPSRIAKGYGSVARKMSSDDRPQRLSSLLYVPEKVAVMSRETIEKIAASAVSVPAPKKHTQRVEYNDRGLVSAGRHNWLRSQAQYLAAVLDADDLEIALKSLYMKNCVRDAEMDKRINRPKNSEVAVIAEWAVDHQRQYPLGERDHVARWFATKDDPKALAAWNADLTLFDNNPFAAEQYLIAALKKQQCSTTQIGRIGRASPLNKKLEEAVPDYSEVKS